METRRRTRGLTLETGSIRREASNWVSSSRCSAPFGHPTSPRVALWERRLRREEVMTIEVLHGRGMSNRAIARQLGVHENAVRSSCSDWRAARWTADRERPTRREPAAAKPPLTYLRAEDSVEHLPQRGAVFQLEPTELAQHEAALDRGDDGLLCSCLSCSDRITRCGRFGPDSQMSCASCPARIRANTGNRAAAARCHATMFGDGIASAGRARAIGPIGIRSGFLPEPPRPHRPVARVALRCVQRRHPPTDDRIQIQ